jgi:pimeloyl-ACP methyl ester carboxylesterase
VNLTSGPFTPPEAAIRMQVTTRDGLRLNAEAHGPQGSGVPSVVLIHGNTCSIPFWAPVIRALRGDLRIVVYDQRGHGGSDIPGDGGYSADALAGDLAAVLEQTIPAGEQAVLAGHSMGGMAIMAAARHESVISRVSGALLASTGCADLIAGALIIPFGGFVPPFAVALQQWLLTSAAPLGPVTPLSRTALRYLTLGPRASAEAEAANADIIQASDRRARAAWGHVLATLDVTDGARQLDVPAHVLVGTADLLTPPAQARRLARLLPRCEGVTELAGIGHMTPLEAPLAVAELIRKLVAGSGPEQPASLEPPRALGRPAHATCPWPCSPRPASAAAEVRSEVSSTTARRRGSMRFIPIAARSSGPGVSTVTRTPRERSTWASLSRAWVMSQRRRRSSRSCGLRGRPGATLAIGASTKTSSRPARARTPRDVGDRTPPST